MKMALIRLAFPINAHQNANQKPIRSAPAYQAQCTLPPQPIYQTLLSIFRGSGSETNKKRCVEMDRRIETMMQRLEDSMISLIGYLSELRYLVCVSVTDS